MRPIEGKVIRVLSPTELVINLGSSSGVSETSRFVIYSLGDEIKDPDTGELLGQLEIVKGRAEAKHIQEKMSTIRSVEKTKLTRDRERLLPRPPRIGWAAMPETEMVTEEVLVPAPFEGVELNDLVRVL